MTKEVNAAAKKAKKEAKKERTQKRLKTRPPSADLYETKVLSQRLGRASLRLRRVEHGAAELASDEILADALRDGPYNSLRRRDRGRERRGRELQRKRHHRESDDAVLVVDAWIRFRLPFRVATLVLLPMQADELLRAVAASDGIER